MSVPVCVDAQQMQEEDILILEQTGPQTGINLCWLEEWLVQRNKRKMDGLNQGAIKQILSDSLIIPSINPRFPIKLVAAMLPCIILSPNSLTLPTLNAPFDHKWHKRDIVKNAANLRALRDSEHESVSRSYSSQHLSLEIQPPYLDLSEHPAVQPGGILGGKVLLLRWVCVGIHMVSTGTWRNHSRKWSLQCHNNEKSKKCYYCKKKLCLNVIYIHIWDIILLQIFLMDQLLFVLIRSVDRTCTCVFVYLWQT